MTPAQELMYAKLKDLRKQKRAEIGYSGAGGGADGAAPITADQGPTQAGGHLGQAKYNPAPASQSGGGRLPGKRRISIGNANRGNIDLGTILSARVDPEAQAKLNADPTADVQRYKSAGFFRSLLGDDANERNEADMQARQQLLTQKWLLDQDVGGKRQLFNEQQAAITARDAAEFERQKQLAELTNQFGVQRSRLDDQNAMNRDNANHIQTLIRDTRLGTQTAIENERNRGAQREIAGMRVDALNAGNEMRYDLGQDRLDFGAAGLLGGRGSGTGGRGGIGGNKLPEGWAQLISSDGTPYIGMPDDKTGQYSFNPVDKLIGGNSPSQLNPDGTQKANQLSSEVMASAKAAAARRSAENAAAPVDVTQEPTVMGGLGALGSKGWQGYKNVMEGILKYNPAADAAKRAASGYQGLGEQLKSYDDQDTMEQRLEQLRKKWMQKREMNKTFPDTLVPNYPQ